MPRIYLTNLASDVTGYKLALVDMKNPSSTALVTSVTNTTGSGDNIQATDTAGGTALKWITKPLVAAATLVTKVHASIWAKESNASANAGLGLNLYPYSAASEGSVFLDHNDTVEAGTTISAHRFLTAAATSQAFAAGDRLVVKLFVVAVGTMGGSQTVTIDYDGPTQGADGDSWIDILEDFRVDEVQLQSGASTLYAAGMSAGKLLELRDAFDYGVDRGLWTSAAQIRAARDLVQFELNKICPRTAITIPA
jgi:hypothetical protein